MRTRPMLKLIIVSRSLATLRSAECITSSQLFELGLAQALSADSPTWILSMQSTEQHSEGNIDLVPLPNLRRLIKTINEVIRQHNICVDGRPVIVFYGYDPLLIAAAKIAAVRHRAKVVAYVFDHHSMAIEHKPRLRRWLIDRYLRTGILALRSIDGILLLNPKAYAKLGLKHLPALVSRVGTDRSAVRPSIERMFDHEPYKIMYAGSLESCNAVVPLIQAVCQMPDPDLRLEIFGGGAFAADVQRLASMDDRITWHGVVSKGEVDRMTHDADLLVNLRDLNHSVADYSFPSKLIGYMASGVPVLSSRVIDDPGFDSMVTVVEGVEPVAISAAINQARQAPLVQAAKARRAQQYVLANHLWPDIAKDAIGFLASL